MAELNSTPEKGGKFRTSRTPVRVDLTAMVDLAFLLITFFMLTTTLQREEAIPIAMPDIGDGTGAAVPMSRTLTLCLGKDNKVLSYMGMPNAPIGQPVVSTFNKHGLGKMLIAMKAEVQAKTGKDMILLLKPSDHSIYDNMVSAIDEVNIARISRYAIVDIAPGDVDLLRKNMIY